MGFNFAFLLYYAAVLPLPFHSRYFCYPFCILLVVMHLSFYLYRTGYVQEQVNIGSAPPGSKVRWFRSASDEPRFINTVTFDSKENAPTLVMVHGYGASQGFFFRNFDALANRFRVIAIDQLG
jgi:pimeloyl-ACP methyl ester carboxylesterase